MKNCFGVADEQLKFSVARFARLNLRTEEFFAITWSFFFLFRYLTSTSPCCTFIRLECGNDHFSNQNRPDLTSVYRWVHFLPKLRMMSIVKSAMNLRTTFWSGYKCQTVKNWRKIRQVNAKSLLIQKLLDFLAVDNFDFTKKKKKKIFGG